MNVYKEFTMLHLWWRSSAYQYGSFEYRFFFLGIHLLCEVSISDVLGRLGIFLVSTFPISDYRKVNVN
jgi:uncharacterized membrane protein (DUF106 family)